ESGLRLAGALHRFWARRGPSAEDRRWLTELLSMPQASGSEPLRARAAFAAGSLAGAQHDHDSARRSYEESLQLYRKLEDERGSAAAQRALGVTMGFGLRDWAASRSLLEASVASFRTLGEQRELAATLDALGFMICLQQGDAVAAALVPDNPDL